MKMSMTGCNDAFRHASDLNPGSVTYRRGSGAEKMVDGFTSNMKLVGFVISDDISYLPDE